MTPADNEKVAQAIADAIAIHLSYDRGSRSAREVALEVLKELAEADCVVLTQDALDTLLDEARSAQSEWEEGLRL